MDGFQDVGDAIEKDGVLLNGLPAPLDTDPSFSCRRALRDKIHKHHPCARDDVVGAAEDDAHGGAHSRNLEGWTHYLLGTSTSVVTSETVVEKRMDEERLRNHSAERPSLSLSGAWRKLTW